MSADTTNCPRFIERLRRQDPEAFRVLLEEYDRRVYGIAHRMIPNHEDVEDVAQEAFVEIWRSLPRFRGDSQLGTWIYRVATNVCLEYRRRRRLEEVVAPEELTSLFDCNETSPQETVERNALREKVARCIRQLPDIYRQVIVLHELQGLSYKEVAQKLGIPEGTVKSRLNASFVKLRDLLSSHLLESEVA